MTKLHCRLPILLLLLCGTQGFSEDPEAYTHVSYTRRLDSYCISASFFPRLVDDGVTDEAFPGLSFIVEVLAK